MEKIDCEGVGDNNGFFEMTKKPEVVMCKTTGKPIGHCVFEEVDGSHHASTYEPSLVHYQKKCMQCGELMFATAEFGEAD